MPTIITRTIDAGGGGDYTTFTAAEAAVVTLVTTDDMVSNDEAIVFECVAGTYNENVTFNSNSPGPALTMDATRNITYRPAAGGEHGGDPASGVRLQNASASAQEMIDDYTVFEGLVFDQYDPVLDSGYGVLLTGLGVSLQGCILNYPNQNRDAAQIAGGSAAHPILLENSVINCSSSFAARRAVSFQETSGTQYAMLNNCTINADGSQPFGVNPGAGSTTCYLEINNCLLVGNGGYRTLNGGVLNFTGAGNTCASGVESAIPLAQQALSQTWTFSTNPADTSTGSQVIYDASTGAMLNVPGNDAVGVGTSTGAPATDILGKERLRGAYADPGAFTTDLVTITKSIDGDGGGDYTTFAAAEAAVTTLPTAGDLVQRNEAIVFEAVAGNYSENFTFFTNSALTCDATRNVTWTHAAGAGHGGQFESGANIVGFCATQEDFSVIDGLSVSPTSGSGVSLGSNPEGAVLRNLMVHTVETSIKLSAGGTAAHPCVVENCVARSDSTSFRPFEIRSQGAGDSHWRVVNNTLLPGTNRQGFLVGSSSADNLYLELANNIVIGDQSYFAAAGPTVILTGSSNVGPDGTYPFPVALQASSQTWTFTTDDQAASTGSQVIYDASNGAMVDAPGNDAWQILTDLSVAPTTDIEGVTREATGYNPGAFERTAADVGTPIGGGVDYLRDINIRDRFLRGAAIRAPFLRNLRG